MRGGETLSELMKSLRDLELRKILLVDDLEKNLTPDNRTKYKGYLKSVNEEITIISNKIKEMKNIKHFKGNIMIRDPNPNK